jgi:predicted GIY-YIG superfamily endonuclease
MPRISKDYSKTIIYKITCKDNKIKDVYVGHTTDFYNRKHVHKHDCEREKTNKKKVYEFINKNGGWNNWEMSILEEVNCKNDNEAREKEKHWCYRLNATLNSYDALFSSFDNEEFTPSSENKVVINKEKTNFRQRKEREELLYLRNENKRLKLELLKSLLNRHFKCPKV